MGESRIIALQVPKSIIQTVKITSIMSTVFVNTSIIPKNEAAANSTKQNREILWRSSTLSFMQREIRCALKKTHGNNLLSDEVMNCADSES